MSFRVLFIVVTLAMLTAGCVSDESDGAASPEATATTQPSTTTMETASWLLVSEPQSDDPHTTATHMAADLEGTLFIDMAARCVRVDSYGKFVVVFPPGTVLRLGPPPEVVMPDGTVLRDGDRVAAGGGGLGTADIERIPSLQHLDVPEACSDITEGAFWLLADWGYKAVESD